MTLLLLAQAAVSVVGWGQIARARDAGGRYDVDLAFDVVGYSMPLTMALQTAACLGVLPSFAGMPTMRCMSYCGRRGLGAAAAAAGFRGLHREDGVAASGRRPLLWARTRTSLR